MAGINSSQLSSDVSVNNLLVGTSQIDNEDITDADYEYDFAFPNNAKRVTIRVRDQVGKFKYTFTQNESGTKYVTIYPGEAKDFFFLDGVTAKTLYFQATQGGQVLEIESWI